MQLETKRVTPLEVKFDDEAGSVMAVFATLNVKDSLGTGLSTARAHVTQKGPAPSM